MYDLILKSIGVPVLVTLATLYIASILRKKEEKETREYERKEKRYKEIIDDLVGFLDTEEPFSVLSKKKKFLDEYRLSWLYASDNVVFQLNDFLIKIEVKPGQPFDKEEAKKSMQELILVMRKDLGNKGSKLEHKDIRIIGRIE